jgi:PAS domain S-box-containing protein
LEEVGLVAHALHDDVRSDHVVLWDGIRRELLGVADKSPLMIWMTEPDGYCIHINQNWYDFTGQALNAAEGDGWTLALHEDHRQQALGAFLFATDRRTTYHTEYRLCRHDKEHRWVVAVGHPYFTSDGKLGGYFGSDASAEGLAMSRRMAGSPTDPARARSGAMDRQGQDLR